MRPPNALHRRGRGHDPLLGGILFRFHRRVSGPLGGRAGSDDARGRQGAGGVGNKGACSLKQLVHLSRPLHRIASYRSADRLRHLIAGRQQRPIQRGTQPIRHVLQ